MTGKIRTVLGDIDPGEIGATDSHEHLLIRNDLILVKAPEFRLDSIECAEQEASDFKAHGGRAIVDCTPIGVGRDPDGLLRISRATGVHIIAATGFHKSSYYLDSHWRHSYSVEEIAKLFADEIELGMEQTGYAGPSTRRSQARGHHQSGVGLSVHWPVRPEGLRGCRPMPSNNGGSRPHALRSRNHGARSGSSVGDLGVGAAHVIVSHVDRNPDFYVHRELAFTGAFLEYDGAGRVKYFPESVLIELMRKMFECDLGGQIVLGGDMARHSYWKAYGGGPGIAYLLEQFLPRLHREGFSDEQIEMLYTGNAARAFQFAAEPVGGRHAASAGPACSRVSATRPSCVTGA